MTTTVRVQSLAAGGEGLGRVDGDGAAVFIYGGLPGDLWRGALKPLGRQAFRLVDAQRIEDGQGRVPAQCVSRPRCGGCDWHEFDPSLIWPAKAQIVSDCLERIAGFRLDKPPEQLRGVNGYIGRHRVGLKVTKQGLAYVVHGSHETVKLGHCSALAPRLEAVMLNVSEQLSSLPPGLVSVQASLSADGRRCAARLSVIDDLTGAAIKHLCQMVVRHTALDGAWLVHQQQIVEAGETRLSGLIATGFSKRYRLRGGGFHQANPGINESLVGTVVDEIAPKRRQRIVDMHGGAGNFGLVLAGKGADVTISEIDPWACQDLKSNASAFRGRGVVHVAEMSGAQALKRCSRRGAVDAVVFDAPRIGDAEGAECVAMVKPRRVVVLGCDPSTFARDLKIMGLGTQYRLTRLGVWDAFPGTHHSESIAVLELAKSWV